jgi:hypothetical protein
MLSGRADRDALMSEALERAGVGLRAHPDKGSFLEELLEVALIEAIENLRPGSRGEQTGHSRIALPNWDRTLGDFDVKVALPGEELPSILVEAKVDDVDQVLWDLLKLAEMPLIDEVVAGYMVVAASDSTWAGSGDCVGLFDPTSGTREWRTREMFALWPRAWRALKIGGAARPLRAPELVEVAFIGRTPVRAFPGHEIRCVAIQPLGPPTLHFFDGDPV